VLRPTVVLQCGGGGAEQLREGGQQVDGKDEEFSQRADRAMAAGACETARGVRIASHWDFATHTQQDRKSAQRVFWCRSRPGVFEAGDERPFPHIPTQYTCVRSMAAAGHGSYCHVADDKTAGCMRRAAWTRL
jgi:hypothetical protein